MPTNLEAIQTGMPRFYAKYDDGSVVHCLIKSFSDVNNDTELLADRVNAMIGIDTTYDEDLQYRWGSILSMDKRSTETYDVYRNRLKMAYPSLVGGTADAIKYAVATTIGITDDQTLVDNYIRIYDAWEYDGEIVIDPSIMAYGHMLCVIDLTVGDGAFNIEDKIIDAINTVKASGIAPHVFYIGMRIKSYSEMQRFSYSSLSTVTYNELVN